MEKKSMSKYLPTVSDAEQVLSQQVSCNFETLLKDYQLKIEDEFRLAASLRERGRDWDHGYAEGYYEGLKHALCILMNKEYLR